MGERASQYMVDIKSGEIVGELRPGDRVVRKESIEQRSLVREWDMKVFYKGNAEELRLLMRDLNTNEKAFLFCIAPYVNFVDSHLAYRNGVDIGSEDLVRITGMDRKAVYSVIASLIKKDVLYKGKNSVNRQYFVNPWLFCKGNTISRVLKTMFKNYRIKVMNGVKWKDLYE